jgi:signal transduction histidine kinase
MALFFDMVHPDDRERLIASWDRRGRTGEFHHQQFRMISRSNEMVWFRDQAGLVHDEQGKPLFIQGVLVDISDLQRERSGREHLEIVSRKLVEVQESERRRIARELHDEIGQTLTGLKLMLEAIARQQAHDGTARLDESLQLVNEIMSRVRAMSLDLRPTMLDDLGLLPALLWLFERYTNQTGIAVAFEHTVQDRRYPAAVETAAFRVVQEALTNVARHAGVREAQVRLWSDEEILGVQIHDQGTGFDEASVASGTSSGLTGMRERCLLIGGKFAMDTAPGSGTRITAEFPLLSFPEASNHEVHHDLAGR